VPTRTDQLRVLARRQHGVFSLKQAVELGFARSTIGRLLERGDWEQVVPRAYRSAVARPVDWRQSTMAMTLVTGGVAAGRSAGALFDFVPPPAVPEVLVSRAGRLPLSAVVRTTSVLPAGDCTIVDGIPSTNPVRTLIDLAGQLPEPIFEDVLDTAIVQGRVRSKRLKTRAQELWAPRRRGCAVVLELLEQRHPDLARAANLWEARVVRIVRQLGMPDPEINHRVHVGGRVRYLDLAWPAAKVAVEFDGFVPHSTRRVFDDDRARQNDLVDDEWAVFRVTKAMLDTDPVATFSPIAAKVARNSPHAVKNAGDQAADRVR
jgi:very-short-patch-repair endonuclease